jgi:uncharacterized protein (TIGR03435 family)
VIGGKPIPGEPIAMVFERYSMPMFAGLLSAIGGVGVVDKTGLSGVYDFKLSWDEDAGPTLSTALQEQLGLSLVRQTVPVAYFIFESAQQPNAN